MTQPPDQLREKRVELILQQLEELPTLPAVAVQRAGGDGRRATSSAQDVVQLIASDPVAHRAHPPARPPRRRRRARRGQHRRPRRRAARLRRRPQRGAGRHRLPDVRRRARRRCQGGHFNREEFWKHCVAVACCAELLAEQMVGTWGKDSERRAVRGVRLRAAARPGQGRRSTRCCPRASAASSKRPTCSAATSPTSSARSSASTTWSSASGWPSGGSCRPTIRDCIWLHGQHPQALPATVAQPAAGEPDHARRPARPRAAPRLQRQLHLHRRRGRRCSTRSALTQRAGRRSAMQQLVEQIEPRAKALGLGQAEQRRAVPAGAGAGEQRARPRQRAARGEEPQARRSARSSSTRSRGFQGELRPDAPPQTVLHAIGQTAVGVLDVELRRGVLARRPAQNFAEVAAVRRARRGVREHAGRLPARSPARPRRLASGRRPARTSGDGPVLAAGDELEWLARRGLPAARRTSSGSGSASKPTAAASAASSGARAPGEAQRLSPQVQELTAIANGWGLALRTAQIREEARTLSEQLAEANRQLHNAQSEILRSQDDDHRRRDGRRRGARDEQPAGGNLRPLAVAGVSN